MAVFKKDDADNFVKEMMENGQLAMVCGEVVEGSNKAFIKEDVEVVEIE